MEEQEKGQLILLMGSKSRSMGLGRWLRLTSGLGQGAELAFGETFGGDCEGAVEARAVIFPTDDRGEFNELALGKEATEGCIEFVGNIGGRAGQSGGETEHRFFAVIKMGAGFELRDVVKLLLGDALFSAHGRMDVNSKRTADQHGDLELGEFFQMNRNRAGSDAVKIQADSIAQVFGVESANPRAQRHVTETTLG